MAGDRARVTDGGGSVGLIEVGGGRVTGEACKKNLPQRSKFICACVEGLGSISQTYTNLRIHVYEETHIWKSFARICL